jgi:hypothetical protein
MELLPFNPKNSTQTPQLRVKGRLGSQAGTKKKRKKRAQVSKNQLPNFFGAASPIVRRVVNTFTTIVSSAGGAISLASILTSGVTAAPSWANISQEFENYRVRQLKVRFVPSTTSATSSTGPYQGLIMVGRFMQLAPLTQSSLEQKSDTAYHSTLEEFEYDANYQGFELAQEWVPVGTALSNAQIYGIAYLRPAATSALAGTSDIFSLRIQFEVEFKKSN